MDISNSTVTTGRGTCGPGCADYDVFIDLSAADLSRLEIPHYLEAIARDAGLSGAAGLVSLALPEKQELPPLLTKPNIEYWKTTPTHALYRAIRRAASLNRYLVVVLDFLLPANEMLRCLLEALDLDPLFGTVQPRFADPATDHVWPLPGNDENCPSPRLGRAGLSILPTYSVTPELLAACMVIRREVVKEMDQADHGFSSTVGELRLLLCQARRRGYRNLVVNHSVLPTRLPYSRVYPLPPYADMERLRNMYPDIIRADTTIANLSQRKLELLLACAYADKIGHRRRLLLDCRGMASQHNGTSHCMLGFLEGFQALDSMWQIDVLASAAAAEFHLLRKRFRKLRLMIDDPEEGMYTAAIMLNQPWALSRVAELHRHSLIVAFNMLDTIAWDILYVGDEHLDILWRFVARYSDAIFYNSQFTRDRFNARFPLQEQIAERVTHHSLAADEQIDQAALRESVGDNILIIGNDYDHKDLRRTLQILVDAFPLSKIVAIGTEGTVMHNVTALPSGQIDQAVLHRIMARARVIVFPSFYEGFGLPVVQGLAYGRPVIVRKSPLWHEIAAQMRMPGELVPFDSVASLVEAVGSALAGFPLKPIPQGTGLGANEQPLRWRDCAGRVICLIEELMSRADGRRWQEREEALEAIRLLH